MFKKIFFILILFPAISYASNNNNEEALTSFQWIQKTHAEKPINFLQLATEAAQMRSDYARTALQVFCSDKLTFEQKFEFAEALNPSSMAAYKERGEKRVPMEFSSRVEMARSHLAASRVAEWARTHFPEQPTYLEQGLYEHMISITTNADLWQFLARSLRAYADYNQGRDIDFSNRLLLEAFQAVEYACNDVGTAQRVSGAAVVDRILVDEVSFSKCILDCLMLHAKLVLKLEDEEMPLSQLIYGYLQDGYVDRIGNAFSLCLFNDQLTQTSQLKTHSSFEQHGLNLKAPMRVVSSEENVRMYTDCKRNGLLDGAHVCLLFSDSKKYDTKLLADTELRQQARDFYLSNQSLSFQTCIDAAHKRIAEQLAAKRAAVAASYLKGVAPFVSSRKAPAPKKKKRIAQLSVADNPNEEAQTQPPAIAPEPAVKARQKPPSEKQKRVAKKERERQLREAAINERLEVERRNIEHQMRMVESIEVTFGEGLCPSLEELDIYACIWGPDSGRKTLCWQELKSLLLRFGWRITNDEAVYIVLTPPAWMSYVKVRADAALNIHFHYSKFMIHKPHDDVLTPMPAYVIAFMREELEGSLGLSEVVVQAMIKRSSEHK
jgi:hypothetical protein